MMKKIYQYLFSILLFVTPLVFTTNTFELYEFPKMIFVYIVGLSVIFLFALDVVFNPRKLKQPSNLLLAFVAANVISALFSSHLDTSIWGYYTRFNGGLVSVLIFFGLYIVATNVFGRNDFKKILPFALLPIIPMGIYAISQHYEPLDRAYSTLGQPNWLAAYLAMVLPVVLYIILSLNRTARFWTIVYLIGFAALWFTYSMSGFLGFAVGTIAVIYLNQKEAIKSKKLLVLMAAISIGIAILNPGIFRERIHDVVTDVQAQENSRPGLEYNISDPGNIRKGLWKGTMHLIFSGPKNLILGTGPETFAYEFQPFRPRGLNYSSEWDFVFNKPHNYYLEVLSNLGLIGFIPYILIIGWTIKKKDKILTPSLIALYVTNIFGWPTVATALLFWLWLAIIDEGTSSQKI